MADADMAGGPHIPGADEDTRWPRARGAGLVLRPVAGDDMPFLEALYASTRMEELAPVPWSEAQKREFLARQFAAQTEHYDRHYPDAERLVVVREAESIGRLYLDRWSDQHRIVDIAFLPQARGRGYGTALLGDMIEEAEALGMPVSIHVERMNPVLSFYQRLGFEALADKGVYLLLERQPRGGAGT